MDRADDNADPAVSFGISVSPLPWFLLGSANFVLVHNIDFSPCAFGSALMMRFAEHQSLYLLTSPHYPHPHIRWSRYPYS